VQLKVQFVNIFQHQSFDFELNLLILSQSLKQKAGLCSSKTFPRKQPWQIHLSAAGASYGR